MMNWNRHCRLYVEKSAGSGVMVNLSEFRITFRISQSVARKPSTAEITVYNVSPDTVAKIQVPLNAYSKTNCPRVVLIAGYEEGHGEIFAGELWWKNVGRASQTDTFMKLIAAHGDRTMLYRTVTTTLKAGYTQDDVLKQVEEKMAEDGIGVYRKPELMKDQSPRGKTIYNSAGGVLHDLANSNNFEYGFTSEGLVTIPKNGEFVKDDPVVILNPSTGLIGRPIITPDGVEVRSLLNPNLKIGSLIRINNNEVIRQTPSTDAAALNYAASDVFIDADGIYRILSREHFGDTRGTEWYTVVKCMGVNSTMAPFTPNVAKLAPN